MGPLCPTTVGVETTTTEFTSPPAMVLAYWAGTKGTLAPPLADTPCAFTPLAPEVVADTMIPRWDWETTSGPTRLIPCTSWVIPAEQKHYVQINYHN